MKNKFRKDQLVILTENVGNCNCSTAKKGTIAKVVDTSINLHHKQAQLEFCKGCGDGNYVSESKIRPLKRGKENATAKKLFEKSTKYKYANIND